IVVLRQRLGLLGLRRELWIARRCGHQRMIPRIVDHLCVDLRRASEDGKARPLARARNLLAHALVPPQARLIGILLLNHLSAPCRPSTGGLPAGLRDVAGTTSTHDRAAPPRIHEKHAIGPVRPARARRLLLAADLPSLPSLHAHPLATVANA